MRLPSACLVVLVGPSGAGKSHWATENFRPEQIVSSDALRAAVGVSEHDQRAGADAFEVLDLILARRLARRLLTVVDTVGLDPDRRATYREVARQHGVPSHAVLFDTPAEVCRARNRTRARAVPTKVLAGQVAARDQVASHIDGEGFDGVHRPEPVDVVPAELVAAPDAAGRQRSQPIGLRFGLQLSSFAGPGGRFDERLAETAALAEAVGFTSLWVMDHVVQIPQVGRPWEDMPESWTTLAWLAAHTRTARLGTLVTGVTLRNPAHLAKIVATLDVLSNGRAVCGLGLAWWKWEHDLYGWTFPRTGERYALLEDTLQLLPVMWGAGSPPFKGQVLDVPETICYPRPVQANVPILLGGSGEKKTLRLAARFADACNVFGDPATVARKRSILERHCEEIGRDPAEVRVTHLSTAVVADSRREVAAAVERLGSNATTPEHTTERLGAGLVDDQIGRYRQLAEAGVHTAIVALPDLFAPGALERFGRVIAAFDPPAPA
ncbi:MAG TPA: TIGR03560 family F420-dependent LLM class oxidoreductase [Acidimicrobiales bacterium]